MSENLASKYQVGEWLVEPDIGKISNSNESRSLRPREMDMLMYLCNHANVVVTVDEMIKNVWRGVLVTNDSVYFSLSQLRKCLGDDSKSPTYIETIPKRGYRLIASVRSTAIKKTAPKPLSVLINRLPVMELVSSVGFLVVVGLGLVMGGYFLLELKQNDAVVQFGSPSVGQKFLVPLSKPDIKSIAVLPFVDLSPGNDQSYFSDGIAEELLFSLSRVKDLKVAARTSSFSFKGSDPGIQEIGKTLNVAHVLEGSVRTEGDTVRISAQLISTVDGFLIWSEVYQRKLSNILQVQDEISRAIVSALKIEITGLNTIENPDLLVSDPELYVKYLKGLDAYRTFTYDSLPKAEQLFTEVTEKDPKFAKAFRMLGMTRAGMHMTGVRRDPGAWESAIQLTEHALELDPYDAQSYAYLGTLYCKNGKNEEGKVMLKKSLEISPSNAQAKVELASILVKEGQRDLARKLFREAIKDDPLSEVVLLRFAHFNVQMGNSELALAGFRRARNANRANPSILYHIGSELIDQFGDLSSAVISYGLATRLDDRDHELAAFLALAYLWTEAPKMAEIPLRKALGRSAKSALVSATQSLMLLGEGEPQQALDLALGTLNDPGYYHSHGSRKMLLQIASNELLDQGRSGDVEQLILDQSPELLAILDGTKSWKRQGVLMSHNKDHNLFTLMMMADVYKSQGRQLELRYILDLLEPAGYESAMSFRDQPRLSDYVTSAELFALRDDDDAALDSLSVAIEGGYRTNWQILVERNHAFVRLRESPKFMSLIQLIKTQAAQHRSILERDLESKQDLRQNRESVARV